MNIYLIGHTYEFEINNIFRIFDINISNTFIYKKPTNLSKDNINIISELLEKDSSYLSSIELYDGEELLFNSKIDSKDIQLEKVDRKKFRKLTIKLSLYEVLSRYYNKVSEYGILTGVRPVKLVFECKRFGLNDEEIKKILKNTYKVSLKKINLIFDTVKNEKKYILKNMNEKNYNLYVGIPFCPTRCVYCSFISYSNYDEKILNKYVDKLTYEIEETIKIAISKGLQLNCLYFGGGTPTVLNIKQMDKMFRVIKKYYLLDSIREITVEAGRPDTISKEKLSYLKQNFINRISINPQTMNDRTLKLIGRKHSVKNIIEKYNLARETNIEKINMDVILGLPKEKEKEIIITMEEIMKLHPDNITIHTLSYKKGAEIYKNKQNQKENDNLISNMYNIALNYCKTNNYEPYYMYRQKNILGNLENTGYTLKGKECIYNIVTIEEKETVLACGVGAVSKIVDYRNDTITRIPNYKNIKDYINKTDRLIEKKKNIDKY